MWRHLVILAHRLPGCPAKQTPPCAETRLALMRPSFDKGIAGAQRLKAYVPGYALIAAQTGTGLTCRKARWTGDSPQYGYRARVTTAPPQGRKHCRLLGSALVWIACYLCERPQRNNNGSTGSTQQSLTAVHVDTCASPSPRKIAHNVLRVLDIVCHLQTTCRAPRFCLHGLWLPVRG
jgi:hypothetical protein